MQTSSKGPDAPDGEDRWDTDAAADDAVVHALGEALPIVLPNNLEQAERTDPARETAELRAEPEAAANRRALPDDHAPGDLVPGDRVPGDHAPGDRQSGPADDGGGRASLVLEKKHLLAVRWMHWINFPVLFTMIWSGLLIYWNDSDNAYLHPHRVYRIGLGTWTLFRFFPDWFYDKLDVPFNVTTGLGYHFFFMWIFAINGVLYVAYLLWSREWRFLVPVKRSFADAVQVTLVDLHVRRELPPQIKYNGAQRIAYTSVIAMGFGALVTGLAIYKPTQTHWLTTLLGGYEMARWLHFLLTLGFCAFFLVHVWQVAVAGWNNFRSMVSGYELRRGEEPSIEAARADAQRRPV